MKNKHSVFCGDSSELMSGLEENSIHAVITDPPYSISLFSLDWDKSLPDIEIWKQCFRVLKPGGFLVAFGHVRAYHRLVCQLEDIGFVIRDCLCWGYASGTPRPYNIDKAIDKSFGIEVDGNEFPYSPKTEQSKLWKGYANVLKPAWEPIALVCKPIEKDYVNNVLKYKTGCINIDENRLPYLGEKDKSSLNSFKHFVGNDHGDDKYFSLNQGGRKQANVHPDGRWPGNMVWTDHLFPEYDKFFMIPKPSVSEKGDYNEHHTVKPIHLMERLISLFTPKPSVIKEEVIVLDPFCGSGTTGLACKRLSRSFIGFELDKNSYETAQRRLDEFKIKHFDMFER